MPITLSIIVLTYNRPQALLAVLRALAPQCDASCEVLIADDGSTSENIRRWQAALPAFPCRLSHIWHPDVGFTAARARNLAASAAQNDYLIFIDGDCMPNARFIKNHRLLAQKGYFVNGSRVLLGRKLTQAIESGEKDPLTFNCLNWLGLRLSGQSNKFWPLWQCLGAPARVQKDFVWRRIRSCNFALWRSDYQAINGFDEAFTGWGHEDADFVWRLHGLGLARINGYWATEVFHLWHQENSRTNEEENRQRVQTRMKQGNIRAERGLSQCAQIDNQKINILLKG